MVRAKFIKVHEDLEATPYRPLAHALLCCNHTSPVSSCALPRTTRVRRSSNVAKHFDLPRVRRVLECT